MSVVPGLFFKIGASGVPPDAVSGETQKQQNTPSLFYFAVLLPYLVAAMSESAW